MCWSSAHYLQLYEEQVLKYTVKPLYSGQYLDLEIVSAMERYPLHRGLSQIGLFCLKNSRWDVRVWRSRPQIAPRGFSGEIV